jgi:hypothetical protein
MRLAEMLSEMADGFAPRDHSHDEISRLIEVLEGKAAIMPSGLIVREGGLISEVSNLTSTMRNGGLRIKLPPAAWVAIFVAIVTGLFNVWAAVAG